MSRVITTSMFEAEVRTWLGTPYKHQGRTKGVAADCVAPPEMTVLHFGLCPGYVPITDYSRLPDGGQMRELLDHYLVRVPKAERRQGDIGHFAWGNMAQHLGVITGRGTVIHAYGSVGKVVEVSLSGSLLRCLRSVYRIPGLEVG